jgi:membrane protein
MPSLWKFGGLSSAVLVKRTIKKLGEDELSARSAALSYYFILALFPMFLFLFSMIGIFAGPASALREGILSVLSRMAPASASGLVYSVVDQTTNFSSGIKVGAGILGALWAASAGLSAVIDSLNVVHGIDETRAWWKQKLTALGLTLALAALIIVALVLVLYGGKIGELIASQFGLDDVFQVMWGIVRWVVPFAAMFISFSAVYYFAPDLPGEWHWITPGAALGVLLWLGASLGFRAYLHFFNSYSATYGSLGAVVILLLWLYMTGFAILIGAELNWVIDQEDKTISEPTLMPKVQPQMEAA